MKKQKYITPIVKIVELDPRQAIFQVCSIGGAYFISTANLCSIDGISPPVCFTMVRGIASNMGNASGTPEAASMPS